MSFCYRDDDCGKLEVLAASFDATPVLEAYRAASGIVGAFINVLPEQSKKTKIPLAEKPNNRKSKKEIIAQ